jgi:hypothetical protein
MTRRDFVAAATGALVASALAGVCLGDHPRLGRRDPGLLQQRRKPEGRFRAPLSGSTAYLCNGAAGADGQSFAGTFTSPNGDYSINVSDAGITIAHGGSNSITLTGDDLTLRSDDIDMRSDRNTTLRDGTTATFDSTGNLSLTTNGTGLFRASGPLNLQGSVINMN